MSVKPRRQFTKWTDFFGSLVSLIGAVAIFAFVVVGYLERDVLRFRGLVLALVLLGLALVVRSEGSTYVLVHKKISR